MRFLSRALGFLILAVAALGPLSPVAAQESQSRFAFVVGSDAYEGAPLATAANDAALVADALKAAQFDVTGARNLDQDTLRASYREFLAKVTAAGPGAVSIVYLSGYGLQFDGENYFVPPGATIARDSDISLNAIRLSDLIRPLSGAPGRGRMVLLDIAYASPFSKQIQGLAPGLAIVEPDAGTIVAFNAAPGTWAQPGKEPYGPYAQALGEMLREPGLPLEEVLVRVRTRTAELTRAAQVPWSAGKIEPALALLERAADAPAPAVPADQLAAERAKPVDKLPESLAYSAVIDRDTVKGYEDFVATFPKSPYTKNVRGLLAARREARTWRRTLDVNTQNAYWSYLKRYPRGPHAAEARRRLTRLQAALEPPPAFDVVAYDDPPPPPAEEVYFDGPDVSYFDDSAPPLAPSVFVAAPPPWYQPPPPPDFEDDDDFFLPQVAAVAIPAWIAPPRYVAPPPQPLMMDAGARPPGWRPYVAIPAALAVGLAAGKLSNHFLNNRRHNAGQGVRPPPGGHIRQPVIPAISSLPKGMNLPTGVRPGQTFVRPTTPAGLQPGRPGIGQPAGGVAQPGRPGVGGRPTTALPGLPAGQPGRGPGAAGQPVGGQGLQPGRPGVGQPAGGVAQPGQPGVGGRPNNALPGIPTGQPGRGPGAPAIGTPMTQPGVRPGQPAGVQGLPPSGQIGGKPGRPSNVMQGAPAGQPGQRPGAVGQPTGRPATGAPLTQPGVRPGQPAGQLQQQQQRQLQQQQLLQQQQQRQQQQRQQQLQQQQLRQQQLQQQRAQQQQQRQLQLQQQQQRQQQQRQQQLQQQQRQQQMLQQQRVQQQQRQQQMLQQQRIQQQQRQQQLQQQQRQQQMLQQQRIQQQQRQQQMMQQQRQQQIMQQQQRQQQMLQQQRMQQQRMQQQRRPCGGPGQPRC